MYAAGSGERTTYKRQMTRSVSYTHLIEVKTTGGSCQDQFFISANELEFAKKHPENYYVYRLYHLMDAPKLAIYSVAELLKLKPIVTQYFMRAVPDEEGQE